MKQVKVKFHDGREIETNESSAKYWIDKGLADLIGPDAKKTGPGEQRGEEEAGQTEEAPHVETEGDSGEQRGEEEARKPGRLRKEK